MSYLQKAMDIQDKVFSGQLLDAFEQYYHQDVVMIEPTGDVRVGKDTNREAEKKFLASVQKWHGGGVQAITSNEPEGITMVESWMDITFLGGMRTKMEQIARQKWQGDHIVEERFYYNVRN
ncbi:MAG: nuclear transport factor 2 family protein [Saprospiraceae bacterium]|nr:nuclear transport factor 2 family protein [Saprospiraceae bacterium]